MQLYATRSFRFVWKILGRVPSARPLLGDMAADKGRGLYLG
jgi:hypothetical protein